MVDDDQVSVLRSGVVFPPQAPDVARAWATVVYEVARLSSGRVVPGVVEPDVGRSFYSIRVAYDDTTVTMLMNPAVRVVGCVRGDRPFPANARYLNVPQPESFIRAGFLPAGPSLLEEALHDRDLALLSEHEAQQVRYHRPARIGDVVFNWFD